MERQFFSGNSVEQAVLAAARHYGLDPARVAYKLRDKKHGFLNIRRRVVIEVDPESPEQPEGALPPEAPVTEQSATESSPASDARPTPSRRHEAPRPPRRNDRRRDRVDERWLGEKVSWTADGDSDPEQAAFEEATEELITLLDLEVESTVQRGEEGFDVELSGPDSDLLVEDRGSALRAVEHLLPRMVRGLVGHGVPCRVDSEGFREDHERELAQLARDAAEDVRHEMRERKLEPMNPADRRLVHMALAEDPTVRTESEGDGFLKRVRILPT